MSTYIIGALVLLSLAGFFVLRGTRPSAAEAQSVAQRVDEGAQLVDVRTPAEFAGGHVRGAVNIPVGDLASRADALDASRPVVVYCRSGARSAAAASQLRARGFEVHDLGPMSAWPTPSDIVR